MKKIIFFILIIVSNFVSPSYNSFQALASSRRKVQDARKTNSPIQKKEALEKCKWLLKSIADEKEKQEEKQKHLSEIKDQMRELIIKGIDLVAKLEAQGISKDQAANISLQSDDHKKLLEIGENFNDNNYFANLILEIQNEEIKKLKKK